MNLHPNTKRLIEIEDEALRLGWNRIHPRTCFCEEVAKRSGEMGKENPSDNAIKIAEKMLEEFKDRMMKWSMS